MKKEFIVQLSGDLFQTKVDIEKELLKGNKSDADIYEKIDSFDTCSTTVGSIWLL